MRKFIVLIMALFMFILCACNQSQGKAGNTYTKISGITATLFNKDDTIPNTTFRSNETNLEQSCILSMNENYIVEVGLIQGGGSTPAFLLSSAIEWEYDKNLITLYKFNADETDTRYCLQGTMPVELTHIKVSTNNHTLNFYITFE